MVPLLLELTQGCLLGMLLRLWGYSKFCRDHIQSSTHFPFLLHNFHLLPSSQPLLSLSMREHGPAGLWARWDFKNLCLYSHRYAHSCTHNAAPTWTHTSASMHITHKGAHVYMCACTHTPGTLCHENRRQPQTSAILITEAWPRENCMSAP